jgi:cyclophilin family peptidyl-prolyl cis-trans isomerase
VVQNFVVQGGDPQGSGWGGPGYTVPDEISRRRFERGTLGMPKTVKDTGGCQVFFTHVATPHLDGNYTAFGRVVSGIEVIDRIEIGDRILSVRVRS